MPNDFIGCSAEDMVIRGENFQPVEGDPDGPDIEGERPSYVGGSASEEA